MRQIGCAIGVFLILVRAGFAQSAGTASISGHVFSAAGHGVRAIVSLQFAAARGFPSAAPRTLAAQDGSFTFQRLPAGQYLVCAQIPQSEGARSAAPFLDTCAWGSGQAAVKLAAAQQLTGVTFTAPNGALLQIRVNDPGQVLPQSLPANGPPTLEPQLQIVVKGPDLRAHHAQFVSKDSGGRNYQMVVPLNTALGLTITSSVASALDSGGNLVQAQIALQATAAAPLNPVTFTLQHTGN